MENVRCQCGKIVCQVKDNEIIIKCRHCKRMIVIKTPGLLVSNRGDVKIEFRLEQSV